MFDFSLTEILLAIGDDPFTGIWVLFRSGGWLLFLWVFAWIGRTMWLHRVQEKAAMKKDFIVLRVTVPRTTEQTPKAVENVFSSLAAAGSGVSWTGKWFRGEFQSPLSVEIVSIEGDVMYCVRLEKKLRDLAEAAIYAQYPDADIDIIEDYAKSVPHQFPDENYDLWGTEMIPTKSDAFPLKTYVDFTDQVSGEMKDPLAVMLENLSRIGPGEQFWYQIVLMPTDQKEARGRADAELLKMKGESKAKPPTFIESVLNFPIQIIQGILNIFIPFGGDAKPPEKKKDGPAKITLLSPGEKLIMESIERKMSKIGFMCKIRVIYVAKKASMQRPKVITPFMGAMRQYNTFNMQSIRPNGKVGMNNDWWFFKDQRNNVRKTKVIHAYMDRSDDIGAHPYFLSVEELATLWHFPILTQVKAPLLRRTEAKKSEAPVNIPYAVE